jgi:hypothetical protein
MIVGSQHLDQTRMGLEPIHPLRVLQHWNGLLMCCCWLWQVGNTSQHNTQSAGAFIQLVMLLQYTVLLPLTCAVVIAADWSMSPLQPQQVHLKAMGPVEQAQ